MGIAMFTPLTALSTSVPLQRGKHGGRFIKKNYTYFKNQIQEVSLYFPRHFANSNPVLNYDRNTLAKEIPMVFFFKF